jgi:hypothetical protein
MQVYNLCTVQATPDVNRVRMLVEAQKKLWQEVNLHTSNGWTALGAPHFMLLHSSNEDESGVMVGWQAVVRED